MESERNNIVLEAKPLNWVRSWFTWLIPHWRQRNRPTVAGWLLILISMGIGIAAYNTASNILFLVLSFVFSLLIVNGILSVSNFRKLGWELRTPEGVRANERVTVEIALKNRKKYQSTYAIWFNLTLPTGKAKRVYLKERLAPGVSKIITNRITFPARGRQELKVEGPESKFPFGFLRKQTGHHVTSEFIVWPAVRRPGNAIPSPSEARQIGRKNQRMGSGTDLVSLRDYQHGDPLRMIHWKATARTGRIMVRNMADESTGSFVLKLDTSTVLWSNEKLFENFLSVASTVAEELFTQGLLQGYVLNDESMVPVRSVGDLYRLNDKLALAQGSNHHPRPINHKYSIIDFVPSGEEEVRVSTGKRDKQSAA